MALQWTLLPIIVVADCLVAVSMIRMQRRRRQRRSQDFRSMEDAKENSVSHVLANKARTEYLTKF
uniref:Uncharacterized protein n=1 Tax=Oryza barthii TaxID=65489 RepID=A0A0D3EJC0_9ORYZ